MIELMQILFWLLLCICATCPILIGISLVTFDSKLFTILSVILLLLIGVCSGVGAWNIDEPVDKYVTIYSVNDQLGTQGNFVLGSGNVKSNIVYVSLLKHDEDIYEQIIIKSHSPIYLIEDDTLTETGYIKWIEGKYTGFNNYVYHYKLEIHVPKGTSIKSFNINGE